MGDATNRKQRKQQGVIEVVANGAEGQQPVQEMIGRYILGGVQNSLFRSRQNAKSVDETQADYEFFDRLRRCKAEGYMLGGLFAKRIERIIASWVLGDGVTIKLAPDGPAGRATTPAIDYTNRLLTEFVTGLLDAGQAAPDDDDEWLGEEDSNNSVLIATYKDALGLGDQHIFVNADGSLSLPSPETVTIKRDPFNYRRWLSVTIETKLDQATITDEYRRDGRTVTIRENRRDGRGNLAVVVTSQIEYENLLGVIPMVHIANDRSRNETNGHSVHEELLPLYDQYDDMLYKQLDGAKLLGTPLLAFVGLKNVNGVVNANKPSTPETYIDKAGVVQERPQLNVDIGATLLVGEGGDAKFVSPPVGFSEDTKTALKSLFLLLLDHTGIPEFIWGGEMGSARASTDTQNEQFSKDIIGWRRDAGGWIVRLCKLWLATKALTDPQIVMDRLCLEWPALIHEDKEIKLKYIETGRTEGLLTDETTLTLLELVDDPKGETTAAQLQAKERQAQMLATNDTAAYGAGLDQAMNEPAATQPMDEEEAI